jgi:hypothetical protein
MSLFSPTARLRGGGLCGTCLAALLPALLALALLAPHALAQDEAGTVGMAIAGVDLRLGGTFQPRASYGFASNTDDADEDLARVGFGLRRARLRATASFGPDFGVYYDVDLATGDLRSVDLHAFWQATPRLRLRAGYLVGAQPYAYALTSHTRLDAVDRAAISERWAGGTIGSSGRDFGFDVRYETDDFTLDVFLHNGDGSFARDRGNFRESVSGLSATRGVDTDGLAVGGFANYEPAGLPGVEVGAFAGYNGSENPLTAPAGREEGRSYVSYAGHLYWGANPGSQPFRLKGDIIGIRYEELPGKGANPLVEAQHSLGYSVFAAARAFDHGEVFARGEQYHPLLDGGVNDDVGADTYFTAGASYSLSARRGLPYRQERMTVAYTSGLPDAPGRADQHLVVIQLQFVF